MRDEAEFILEVSNGLTKEELLGNSVLKRAIVRSLEVMGEAAKQVPHDFREQHPDVPWRSIAGMRDRLIHGYLNVNYNIVWDTVQDKIFDLHAKLGHLIGEAGE